MCVPNSPRPNFLSLKHPFHLVHSYATGFIHSNNLGALMQKCPANYDILIY